MQPSHSLSARINSCSLTFLHSKLISKSTGPTEKIRPSMSLIPGFFGDHRGGGVVFDPFSWDPFGGFGVTAAMQPSGGDREAAALANARIDWKETPEAHVFRADLPGLKKEEVKVEVEDGRVLQISGERRREQEEKTDKWHRVERSSGRFARRFRLPENVRMDGVRANMENGVLTVVVPKAEEKKPEVRAIDVAGGEPERERGK